MKIKKKFLTRNRISQVKTIENSEIDLYSQLEYFKGVYTVRNIVPETSDDVFQFGSENMIPGYLDSSSKNTISVLGNQKKIVISFVNSYYHSILDNMSEAIWALHCYPKHELIIDISGFEGSLKEIEKRGFFYHSAFLYFLETLKIKKIKYRLVELKKAEIVYLSNFRLSIQGLESIHKADFVYDFFKDRFSKPETKPYRKVFISRSLTVGREYEATTLKVSHDNRIDDHEKLDNFFKSMGYDVIKTEDFDSFQEQIDFFYETKVLASITGSGLTNSVFMQPGQTLIEIVTPLVLPIGRPGEQKDLTDPYYVQELHNFYKNLAFYKNHTFFGIHNESRSFETLEKTINSDSKIKNFLDRSDE